MFTTPHLDSHSTTDPKREILSAVEAGNRISHDGWNERGIMHVRMCKKDNIRWQRRLNHSQVGGGIALRRVYPAWAYTTVVVLVLLRLNILYMIMKHTVYYYGHLCSKHTANVNKPGWHHVHTRCLLTGSKMLQHPGSNRGACPLVWCNQATTWHRLLSPLSI